MGKVFDEIDDKLAGWIGRQRMFFVGTAPSGSDGHVNVSPKGPIESLRIFRTAPTWLPRSDWQWCRDDGARA